MNHHAIGNEDARRVKHIRNIEEAALLINQFLAMLRNQACNTVLADPEHARLLVDDTIAVVTALRPYGGKLNEAASYLDAQK